MYFVCVHENRTMKPDEIVLRSGGGRMMEGVNLIYIVSTYVNVTMKKKKGKKMGRLHNTEIYLFNKYPNHKEPKRKQITLRDK
jgi:hypothetical protein